MRPRDCYPQNFIDELLRLARKDPDWVTIERNDDGGYRAVPKYVTWLLDDYDTRVRNGSDVLAWFAASVWMSEGPKTFVPTADQAKAMSLVDVNIPFEDYKQPYRAIRVDLRGLGYGVESVLVFHDAKYGLIAESLSLGNRNDIVLTIVNPTTTMEEAISKFDKDVPSNTASSTHVASRIAINCCLALSNWPTTLSLMFPKETDNDRHLAKHGKTEEARIRAAKRLSLPVQKIAFEQVVHFHHVETRREPGAPTGREMPPHWRRGHWSKVACGAGRVDRRLVFKKATMVRSDLFMGEASSTSVEYKQ